MGQDNGCLFVDDAALASFGDLDFSIYNAILRNRDHIANMRICDIAEIAGVSNASVVRFSKKCGYNGFPELRAAAAAKPGDVKHPTLPSVLSDLKSSAQRGHLDTLQRQIDEAFELLRGASGVLFIGNKRSGGLAEYGASLFCGSGIMSIPVTSLPSYLTTVKHPNACAVVISHSGTSPQLLAAIQELSANGTKIIAVTGDEHSSVALLSDACIGCWAPNHTNAFGNSMDTQVPAMLVIEELARKLYNEIISHL